MALSPNGITVTCLKSGGLPTQKTTAAVSKVFSCRANYSNKKAEGKITISRKIIENSPVWGSAQRFSMKSWILKGILPTWPIMHPLSTYARDGGTWAGMTPVFPYTRHCFRSLPNQRIFPTYIYLPFCAAVLPNRGNGGSCGPADTQHALVCSEKVLIQSPLKRTERLSLTSVSAGSGPKSTLHKAVCSNQTQRDQNWHASFPSWHKTGLSPRDLPKEG